MVSSTGVSVALIAAVIGRVAGSLLVFASTFNLLLLALLLMIRRNKEGCCAK
jgi:hypothetical protein